MRKFSEVPGHTVNAQSKELCYTHTDRDQSDNTAGKQGHFKWPHNTQNIQKQTIKNWLKKVTKLYWKDTRFM